MEDEKFWLQLKQFATHVYFSYIINMTYLLSFSAFFH